MLGGRLDSRTSELLPNHIDWAVPGPSPSPEHGSPPQTQPRTGFSLTARRRQGPDPTWRPGRGRRRRRGGRRWRRPLRARPHGARAGGAGGRPDGGVGPALPAPQHGELPAAVRDRRRHWVSAGRGDRLPVPVLGTGGCLRAAPLRCLPLPASAPRTGPRCCRVSRWPLGLLRVSLPSGLQRAGAHRSRPPSAAPALPSRRSAKRGSPAVSPPCAFSVCPLRLSLGTRFRLCPLAVKYCMMQVLKLGTAGFRREEPGARTERSRGDAWGGSRRCPSRGQSWPCRAVPGHGAQLPAPGRSQCGLLPPVPV